MLKMANQALSGSAFIPSKFAPDLYEELLLRLSGTQAAGQFMSIGEVGRVRYKEHGRPVIDCDFDMLHYYNELKGGDIEFTGDANAAAFRYSVIIPRGFGDGNCHLITQADEPQFQLDFYSNAVAHVAAGGLIQLSGRPRVGGIQKYRLMISQRDFVFTGASNPVEQVVEKNILAMYFDRQGTGPNSALKKTDIDAAVDANTNFLELTVKKDRKVIVDETVGALAAISNHDNRVESAYKRLFEVRCVDPSVDPSEALSDEFELQFRIAGATTVRCLILSADFSDEAKYDGTVAATMRVLNNKLAQKRSTNQPILTVEKMIGLAS